MKIKTINKCAFFFCILSFSSCYISNNDIKSHSWKCGDPCGLGDVLDFNNDYFMLKDDTVFRKKIAVGVIIKREYRWHATNILHVRNIENNAVGIYHQN